MNIYIHAELLPTRFLLLLRIAHDTGICENHSTDEMESTAALPFLCFKIY